MIIILQQLSKNLSNINKFYYKSFVCNISHMYVILISVTKIFISYIFCLFLWLEMQFHSIVVVRNVFSLNETTFLTTITDSKQQSVFTARILRQPWIHN